MFFKKKTKSRNQEIAESLPFKFFIRFEDKSEADIRTDIMISPINLAVYTIMPYQKSADAYLGCSIYYNKDLSKIYYKIDRLVNDEIKYSTDFYETTAEIFTDLAERAGRKINVT